MQKLITFRFALPAIVILTVIALAFIAIAAVAHAYTGTAWGVPCC